MFFPKCPCCGGIVTIRKFRDSDGVELWNNTRGARQGEFDQFGTSGASNGPSSRTLIFQSGGYNYAYEDFSLLSVGHAVDAADEGDVIRWIDDGDGGRIDRYSETIADAPYDPSVKWINTGTGSAAGRFAIEHLGRIWTAGATLGNAASQLVRYDVPAQTRSVIAQYPGPVSLVQAYEADSLEGLIAVPLVEWSSADPQGATQWIEDLSASRLIEIGPHPGGILVRREGTRSVPVTPLSYASESLGVIDFIALDGSLSSTEYTYGDPNGLIGEAGAYATQAVKLLPNGTVAFITLSPHPDLPGMGVLATTLVIADAALSIIATRVLSEIEFGMWYPDNLRWESRTTSKVDFGPTASITADATTIYANVPGDNSGLIGFGGSRCAAFSLAGAFLWSIAPRGNAPDGTSGSGQVTPDGAGNVFYSYEPYSPLPPDTDQPRQLVKVTGGVEQWVAACPVPPDRVITSGGNHYVASLNGELAKVSGDGQLLWTARHHSDGGTEAILDIVRAGGGVFIVGEGSTYDVV